jgi:2-phosphosulfolactate phosphatase
MAAQHAQRKTQDTYRCRLDWGWSGVRRAAASGDIVVIVDTLSFSTTAITAVQHGGIIYPCASQEQAARVAQQVGAELAVMRKEVPAKGRFSLSPITFLTLESGCKIAISSPNGATCCGYGSQAPALLVGTLINARAVAATLSELLEREPDLNATIIACGERWRIPTEDGSLRFASEDYLGAGAILSYLNYAMAPEANLCRGAFLQASNDIEALLWECNSGNELRDMGFEEDVRHAARLNAYETVPILRQNRLIAFTAGATVQDE